MALDKLVDSAQLDTDLTAVADAIRTKGGTSAPLNFPQGFVDAIGDIETGGGGDDYLAKRITNTLTEYTITGLNVNVGSGAFMACSNLTSLSFPDVVTLGEGACNGTGLTTVHLKQATFNGYNIFRGCAKLETFVCENATIGSRFSYLLYDCAKLTTVDIKIDTLRSSMFTGTKTQLIILRKSDGITTLQNINQLTDLKAFKSGGTGGTIYIPKALYDHLGDGTSLDYQAAANWSTVHGYGTITWAQIEGSIYETQYADGTPISTT